MSNSTSLIFFNKEGYPHNFQYNTDTESWEGKIIFDENSQDTFKTQSFYIFEDVPAIEFNCQTDLTKITYFNFSGLTIAGETVYTGETITNITKVNASSDFYTTWIYGYNFHKKFSKGTVISFSGVTGFTNNNSLLDFSEDQYFTVLDIKKNAVMIQTNTNNSLFNLEFHSGIIIKSLNTISINDYNNDPFFQNLYVDKKLTIINSDNNDSIVNIEKTGKTYTYLNEFLIAPVVSSPSQNNLTLRIEFFTERPKLAQGNFTFYEKEGNAFIDFGKTINSNFEVGKELIFQNSLGETSFNGFTFVILDVVDTIYCGRKTLTFKKFSKSTNRNMFKLNWNIVQYDGYLQNINKGDTIQITSISGDTTMHNREFIVGGFAYTNGTTIITTPDYIINESGNAYDIYIKLRPNQIKQIQVQPSGYITPNYSATELDATCYSTSTLLDFTQLFLSGGTHQLSTINAFINKHNVTLNQYGINAYYSTKNNSDYLSIESLYGTKYKYFNASGFTNGTKIADNFTLSNNSLVDKYDIILDKKLLSERTNRSNISQLCKNATAEVFFNLNYTTNLFGFRLTLNSNEYYIKFTGDTQTTINSFINSYSTIMYNNGFIISSNTASTLNIITTSVDSDIWNLDVMVNILSTYTIKEHQRNNGIILSGNEIRNSSVSLFSLGLSTGMVIKISGSTFYENNKEYNIIGLTDDTMCLSYQGSFYDESSVSLSLKSREFLRKPRGEYNKDIYLRAYWDIPYGDVIDDSIFLYDITGNQLAPYDNITSLTYIGPKPLINYSTNNVVFLNKTPNDDATRVTNPKYQQTVFNELNFKLEQLDSSEVYNWLPEPLEIFVGYSSVNEGVNNRVLKIEKIEKIENTNTQFSYSGRTTSGNTINNFVFDYDTLYSKLSDFDFISYGFEKNQLIKFTFKDQASKNQIIFENIDTYKILELKRNKLIFDTGYTSGFTYFSTTGATFEFKIEVQPAAILSCSIYGQTEIEDIRYKINLNNVGIQLEDDVYQILYDSDIQDNAIDYTLLNRKRKEMLTDYREVYDYIGSYKALINSINFFGYNDLKLYEYYKNINQDSPLYGKIHKILIPDIFDNTVEGWNEIDFISGKYQNQSNWKKTNLFNLAYNITDEDGNNILTYSLDEVQFKLTKLKKWLRQNIIPISANLLDITGVADANHTLYQDYDESNLVIKSVVERSSTVVNFNYTAALNFGSDYLISVNFYMLSGHTGTTIDYNEKPIFFTAKVKTFARSGDTMIPVQYHKIIKNDLEAYSFNIDKYTDPYIYIETTTYDNDGSGIGYVNNKMFYFDEPRNFWLVNHNFDMTKFKFWQTTNYGNNINQITKNPNSFYNKDILRLNTLNKTYLFNI